MRQRLPVVLFAVVMAIVPFVPGMPPFWIVLLDNIGLSALVAMGLVMLTGVGGLTSFGQAAFCGFGAYTTAVLTTAYGLSPWLTLPLSLLVSGVFAVALGLITVRLSGHYLPLGTLAWGLGLFYLFSKLEFLGRNDGISSIPPLAIGSLKMIGPGTIYFAIWTAVILCALLTMNRLALCAFPARRESNPVRRPDRHRISFRRGGRRRRLRLGRRIGRRDRRCLEGNPSGLFALPVPRRRPARNDRVRHDAGAAAPARA
jgi:Branched-chain amino acid transport system / permease component